MPGLDRKGPAGAGPGTGRGLGRCPSGANQNGGTRNDAQAVNDRPQQARFLNRGRGGGKKMGQCFGGGPGRGRGRGKW